MKITAQEEYGLRCLLRLARVDDGSSLTIPEIAANEGLSGPYVAKLLALLRQAGLIESVRGRSGGYRLAQAPTDIALGSVLAILGEPLFDDPGYCQRHHGTGNPDGVCVHHSDCSLRALWQTLEQWMSSALARVTLADLLDHQGGFADLLRTRLAEALQETSAPLIELTALRKD